MSHEAFIADVLNVKPELISEISTAVQSDGSLIAKVKLVLKSKLCPCCSSSANIHGYYQRKLTHSVLANRNCTIIYLQRRFKCPVCCFTFCESNPFSASNDGLTHITKINILKELKYPEATYASVARRYNVSPQTVLRLFDKHVSIPRKPLPTVLSVDEHYFPESDYDSLYCCLLMDFLTVEIIDVLPDRRKNYMLNYLSKIKAQSYEYSSHTSELDNVRYFSTDLSDNFRDVAKTYFPNAVICADSFHVLQHLTKSFRDVRLKCRRTTQDPVMLYLLTKFKFVFHHATKLDNEPKYNKRIGRYVNYRDLRDIMLGSFPELEKAYNLKEYYLNFNRNSVNCCSEETLDKVITLFADSGISEYEEFYNLLRNWKQEIINSFNTVEGRRINNSYIESKNRLLEKLLYNANGFSNFERTRKRIIYCLNKDEGFTL